MPPRSVAPPERHTDPHRHELEVAVADTRDELSRVLQGLPVELHQAVLNAVVGYVAALVTLDRYERPTLQRASVASLATIAALGGT